MLPRKFRNLEALKCHFQHSGHQIITQARLEVLVLHGHPMCNSFVHANSSLLFSDNVNFQNLKLTCSLSLCNKEACYVALSLNFKESFFNYSNLG